MWVCMSEPDGFISIVADRDDPNFVWVRARNGDHLENLLPECDVLKTPDADYGYRVRVEKVEIAQIVSDRIFNISYSNFKNSVKEKRLKTLFSEIWLLGVKYQDAS